MPPGHKRIRARAKLNLFLSIGAREGPLHLIDSVFQTVSLADVLDFFALNRAGFRVQVVEGSISGGDTLIRRALEVLAESEERRTGGRLGARADRGGDGPRETQKGMAVALHKRIPEGAGLGGGSADAAAALVAANDLWGLHWTPEQLRTLSREVGADVAYFLTGGTCRVTGTGDRVEPRAPLPRYYAVTCFPGIPVASTDAYGWWDEEGAPLEAEADSALERLRAGERPLGRTNAFETLLVRRFPVLGEMLALLDHSGAFWAGVTGSGSAVYGLFKEQKPAAKAASRIRMSGICEVRLARFVESAIEEVGE
jgi:4-diphosphocytidyl-2-C-methyl-D-erythritol kinase